MRKIDEMVLVKVFGATVGSRPDIFHVPGHKLPFIVGDNVYRMPSLHFAPSKNIGEAMTVAEAMSVRPDDRWFLEWTNGHTLAVFRPSQPKDVHAKQYEGTAPNRQLAICIAALKFANVPESEITAAMEAK